MLCLNLDVTTVRGGTLCQPKGLHQGLCDPSAFFHAIKTIRFLRAEEGNQNVNGLENQLVSEVVI